MGLYWLTSQENNIDDRLAEIFTKKSLIYVPSLVTQKNIIDFLMNVFAVHAAEETKYKKCFIIYDAHMITGLESKKTIPATISVRNLFTAVEKEYNIDIACISPYSYNEIPVEIRDEFHPIQVSLPNEANINKWFPNYKYKEYLLGMTKRQMKYVVELGLDARKQQAIIFASDGFDIIEPRRTFDSIGGFKNLREWIEVRKQFFIQNDPLVPLKGIILVGAPGTGKSVICEAVANYLNLPYLNWNVAKIMSSLYGETERRIKNALDKLNILKRAVLRIDEIDKIFAGYESSFSCDAGTTARMIGVMQSWLAEQKNIFIIGTTNKPLQIDDAMIRKGRFNEIFYVPLPDENTRKEIIKIYSKKFNICLDGVATRLIRLTDGLVGAEIESIFETMYIYSKTNRDIISNMDKIIENIKSSSRSLNYDQSLKILNYTKA